MAAPEAPATVKPRLNPRPEFHDLRWEQGLAAPLRKLALPRDAGDPGQIQISILTQNVYCNGGEKRSDREAVKY